MLTQADGYLSFADTQTEKKNLETARRRDTNTDTDAKTLADSVVDFVKDSKARKQLHTHF